MADFEELKETTPTAVEGQSISVADGQPRVIAGRYEIISYIGGGGMSNVYKACHVHMRKKIVALKLLRTKPDTLQQIQRLQQEATAVSSLSHPNIIAVHDFGVDDQSEPYLVMDYFEGESLDKILKHNPMPIERLLPIVEQICAALSHAHQNGIVHRDIKPSNILIANENGRDIVKVVDFGIAKITGADAAEASKLTQTGDVLGSPQYMSPEQCLGQRVDGQTDIYSLGCVIYELATGAPPFSGDSMFETIYKHLNECPRPFSSSLTKDNRFKRLEAIVLKMLAKRSEDRYRFLIEAASELKQLEDSSSKTGRFALMWKLWKARQGAQAGNETALNIGLVTSSLLAVLITCGLVWLPMAVSKLAMEEARTATIRIALDENAAMLKGDHSVVDDLFISPTEELTQEGIQERLGMDQRLDTVERLLTHQYERDQLKLIRAQIAQSAMSTVEFRETLMTRIKVMVFGSAVKDVTHNGLGKLMSSWTSVMQLTNELYTSQLVAERQAHDKRIFYMAMFNLAKWFGTALLLLMSLLLYWKWRGRAARSPKPD